MRWSKNSKLSLLEKVNCGNILQNLYAKESIPKDAIRSGESIVALKSDESGNCLYSSLSLCVLGNDLLVDVC